MGKPAAVGYSGPTSEYVAIRSGKHSSSTALAHGLDFERLLCLPEFDALTKYGPEKSIKPILMLIGMFTLTKINYTLLREVIISVFFSRRRAG